MNNQRLIGGLTGIAILALILLVKPSAINNASIRIGALSKLLADGLTIDDINVSEIPPIPNKNIRRIRTFHFGCARYSKVDKDLNNYQKIKEFFNPTTEPKTVWLSFNVYHKRVFPRWRKMECKIII